jgi:hypothetical protein
MGALGLLAVYSVTLWRNKQVPGRYVFTGVCGGIAAFMLFGLDPSSDVVAHSGGFVAGCALGSLLAFVPKEIAGSRHLNISLITVFIGFVVFTWGLALKH